MATSHHLQFPPFPESSFELEISAPNQELHILYQQLPFRLLKISYQMPQGHYLSYNASESWRDYSYSALCKRASRVQHPSDPNVGLLVLCPKHSPLVGPICPPSLEQHSCFSDHAFKILINGDDEELTY
ncbi:hypothetical protein EV702DRAFT_1196074 [Suillus placidus]|uniref:Uncharacterized protein n=1 Tax=Suillus placidus TaxID=48579 RepID=A0A9P7D376_9AGAM|nr:hypothetical protein EV702DRAFT_1196074 [Suillus placidus]